MFTKLISSFHPPMKTFAFKQGRDRRDSVSGGKCAEGGAGEAGVDVPAFPGSGCVTLAGLLGPSGLQEVRPWVGVNDHTSGRGRKVRTGRELRAPAMLDTL